MVVTEFDIGVFFCSLLLGAVQVTLDKSRAQNGVFCLVWLSFSLWRMQWLASFDVT
jgi:hypothetical protein